MLRAFCSPALLTALSSLICPHSSTQGISSSALVSLLGPDGCQVCLTFLGHFLASQRARSWLLKELSCCSLDRWNMRGRPLFSEGSQDK